MNAELHVGSSPAARPSPEMMRAIAVLPGQANSMHLASSPSHRLERDPRRPRRAGQGAAGRRRRHRQGDQRGRVRRGAAGLRLPGHRPRGLRPGGGGRARTVTELAPGDYVVATVRRPGSSIYDRIGTYDMTTDDIYFERGINLRHGYLTEYYVDDAEYIVKVPPGLKEVGVLLEPTDRRGEGHRAGVRDPAPAARLAAAASRGHGRRHHRPAGGAGAAAARARGDRLRPDAAARTSTPT